MAVIEAIRSGEASITTLSGSDERLGTWMATYTGRPMLLRFQPVAGRPPKPPPWLYSSVSCRVPRAQLASSLSVKRQEFFPCPR